MIPMAYALSIMGLIYGGASLGIAFREKSAHKIVLSVIVILLFLAMYIAAMFDL